jgi:transposase
LSPWPTSRSKSSAPSKSELRALSAWLKQHRVRKVAMEATGVYWIALHDHLQAEGFESLW